MSAAGALRMLSIHPMEATAVVSRTATKGAVLIVVMWSNPRKVTE